MRDARRAGRGARGGVVAMAVEDVDGASSSAAEAWERITAMASAPGVCDLGQGWPDFGESATARKVAMEALAGDGARANQYSPVSGAKALVEALEAALLAHKPALEEVSELAPALASPLAPDRSEWRGGGG